MAAPLASSDDEGLSAPSPEMNVVFSNTLQTLRDRTTSSQKKGTCSEDAYEDSNEPPDLEPISGQAPLMEEDRTSQEEVSEYLVEETEDKSTLVNVAIGNVQLFVILFFILYARWRFKIVCLQTKLASIAIC